MQSLGIDIGGSSVKAAALADGKVLWTGQSACYSRPSRPQLLAAIREAVKGPVVDARRVGLCVPGLLDRPRRIITLAVNVPGLMNIALDDLVSSALICRVGHIEIASDSTASAVDIIAARGLTGRLLCLAIGTGVGAAVLDDGRPLMVEGGLPGHLGQLDVSLDGNPPIGPDGGAGSLEAYLGVAALKSAYGDDLATVLPKLTADAPAMKALCRAIRVCHAIYRPNHIILCGGMGIRLKHLLEPLRARISQSLTSVARPDWTLSFGDHDFHAAAGAARIAQGMPR